MNLKEKVKNLPLSPGVYLMKDSHGTIIYVGKSKKLKTRVQSYFQKSKNHSKKVIKLVHQIKDFEYILTDTEFEAFLLECTLIKEIQPFYNKLMKSPQSYTYIVIRMDRELDRIKLSNHLPENDNDLYFGPFTSKNSAEKAILGLKEFFNSDCSHPYNHSPCLNYSLGLCIGMCFKTTALEQYHCSINRIIALFEGTDSSIIDEMNQKMIHASENFDYERASMIRDYLEAIHSLLKKEKVIDFTKEKNNIVLIESLSDHLLKLFLIKGNKVLFSHLHEFDKTDIKRLCFEIKSKILAYFKIDTHPSSMEISKDEIDEAQIIYNYLTSSLCNYLIIPENWLYSEDRERLDLAIEELLLSNLEKTDNY